LFAIVPALTEAMKKKMGK